MALRIPVDNLPSVAPGQLPGVRLSPAAPEDAFGYGPAADQAFYKAGALANDVSKLAMQEKEKADMAAVFRATAELSKYGTELQYNPETGIVAQKGENALGLRKSIPEAWSKKVNDLMGTLATPEQRENFQHQADQHFNELNRFNQAHVAGEVQNFMHQQNDAYIGSEVNAAGKAAAAGDLARVNMAAQNVESAREAWGIKSGMPRDAKDFLRAKDVSAVYSEAVQSLLAGGNDLAAKSMFDQNADRMTENDKQRLAPVLNRGSIAGEAQRAVDEAWEAAAHSREGGPSGQVFQTEADATSWLKTFTEGMSQDVQDEAKRRMSHKFDEDRGASRDLYAKDVNDAENLVSKFGTVDAVPPQLYERLKGKELRGLYALAKELNTKDPIRTDWKVYSNLKDMAANQATRNDFLKMHPMAWRADLGDTEFKEMVNLREGLIKGDDKAKKQIDGYRTISGIINTHLDNNGYKEKDAPAERELIEQLMDEEIKYWRVNHKGEDPSNEEVKKMVSQMTQDVVVNPDAWFGGKDKGYKVTQKYLDTADVGVPPEERKKIEAAMERQGIAPTRRAIIEAWRAKNDPSTKWMPK